MGAYVGYRVRAVLFYFFICLILVRVGKGGNAVLCTMWCVERGREREKIQIESPIKNTRKVNNRDEKD